MSGALDMVLPALSAYKVHPNGPHRYRAICPVCGERNPNTLSVGERPDGAVLIKCFKFGCSIESIASAIGLNVADLFPPRESTGRPAKPRRLLTATQALGLLEDVMVMAQVCSAQLAEGKPLTAETRKQLLQGAARVWMYRDEVRS